MKQNILIVTGHTHPEMSVGNKEIIKLYQEKYPDAKIDDLYQLYPDYKIDIKKEQEKLLWADLVIIQSPLFWYSPSSIIMRWIEEVFKHGWAYGSKGNALKNKKVIVGLTAGSTNEDYQLNGKMGITISEIVKPLEIIFTYSKMKYIGAVFTGGMFNTGHLNTEQIHSIKNLAKQHFDKISTLIAHI